MSGVCPGSTCLYDLLIGRSGQGQGPPPKSAKDSASEHELWLEGEVSRLQAEYWRLQDLNDNMKNELFYLLSAPKRTVTNFSSFFDHSGYDSLSDDGKHTGKRVSFGEEFGQIEELGRDQDSVPDPTRPMESESEPASPQVTVRRLSKSAANIEEDLQDLDVGSHPSKKIDANASKSSMFSAVSGNMKSMMNDASAMGMTLPMRIMIYTLALGFVIFVLIATATNLGAHDDHGHHGLAHGDSHDDVHGDAHDDAHDDTHGAFDALTAAAHGDAHDDGHGAVDALTAAAHGDASVDAHGALDAATVDAHAVAEDSHAVAVDAHAVAVDPHAHHRRMDEHAHHRRLGTGPTRLMKNIAVTLTGCGLLTLFAFTFKLPLIIGYILGGMLVGPLGLGIVESHVSMSKMSSLGLVFVLFMIGLELDVKSLFTQMGKVTVLTGLLSLPLTGIFMLLFLLGFQGMGISFGDGDYAAHYCAVSGALASTIITVKALEVELQVDSLHGRRTVGILICQNLWAIVLLALQANIGNFSAGSVMTTFLWLCALILFALGYAKFVMPAALYYASKSVELMLVLSLAWCFFICVAAILPFVNLPMEMAALVAGIALATFPYSAEFNAKIKYIRDFFLILFFGSLGMMLPAPTWETLGGVFFTGAVLLGVRWIGVFLPAIALGSATRYAAMSTINLCQVGELALVLCSLGVAKGHIGGDTLLTVTALFLISGAFTGKLVKHNYRIYKIGEFVIDKVRGTQPDTETAFGGARLVEAECDVMLLGFHKIAYMLVAEFHAKTPEQLQNIHVIDFSKHVLSKLRDLGMTCTVGDIASPQTLERAQKHQPSIVISTIPDTHLNGITNAGVIKNVKEVWPDARMIVTAESPQEARDLYEAGADYVVRMAKLSAERLHDILADESMTSTIFESSKLKELFESYKIRDNAMRGATRLLGEKLLS